MEEQLSLKAAMPLAEILATCRKNVSNTGPRATAALAALKNSYVALYIFNDLIIDFLQFDINIHNMNGYMKYMIAAMPHLSQCTIAC